MQKPKGVVSTPSKPAMNQQLNSYQPVHLKKLHEYVRKKNSHTTDNFEAEFKDLECHYASIITNDDSQVVLHGDACSGSIDTNAFYVNNNGKPKVYLACYGHPSEGHIWKIVWQERISIILTVSAGSDNKKHKFRQYWPGEGETLAYGDITVRLISEEINNYFVIRRFHITMGDHDLEQRSVLQYDFTAWPDADVPKTPAPLLEFVHSLREAKHSASEASGPIFVYSAKVQWTGIAITIDAMLDMAEEKDQIDVFNFVKEMQNNRFQIIQNEDQYMFIYETLLESLFCGPTKIPLGSFYEAYKDIKEKKSRLGTSLIQEQLNTLNALVPLLPHDKTNTGSDSQKGYSLPLAIKRHLLSKDEEENSYINASIGKIQGQPDRYLVTQAPKSNTMSDFWRMIYEYNCYTIVMLNAEDADDKTLDSYIPREFKVAMCFGALVVQLQSAEQYGYVTKRKIHITKDKGKPREIHHLQYLHWPKDSQKPSSLESFFQFRSDVVQAQRAHQDNVVTVHCLDGRSRSGCFCVMDSVIQMINEASSVDVYHTVKKIKCTSPSLIHTKEQYELCYEMAKISIDSLHVYGNVK